MPMTPHLTLLQPTKFHKGSMVAWLQPGPDGGQGFGADPPKPPEPSCHILLRHSRSHTCLATLGAKALAHPPL